MRRALSIVLISIPLAIWLGRSESLRNGVEFVDGAAHFADEGLLRIDGSALPESFGHQEVRFEFEFRKEAVSNTQQCLFMIATRRDPTAGFAVWCSGDDSILAAQVPIFPGLAAVTIAPDPGAKPRLVRLSAKPVDDTHPGLALELDSPGARDANRESHTLTFLDPSLLREGELLIGNDSEGDKPFLGTILSARMVVADRAVDLLALGRMRVPEFFTSVTSGAWHRRSTLVIGPSTGELVLFASVYGLLLIWSLLGWRRKPPQPDLSGDRA